MGRKKVPAKNRENLFVCVKRIDSVRMGGDRAQEEPAGATVHEEGWAICLDEYITTASVKTVYRRAKNCTFHNSYFKVVVLE